jgi:hypothetical protein
MIELMYKYKHLLLTIILLRFLATWFVFPHTERLYNGDSKIYEDYAISMIETGEYLSPGYGKWAHLSGSDPMGEVYDPFADMIRPPGLPFVLWGVYSIVGPTWGPWVFSLLNGLLSIPILMVILSFFRLLGMERYAGVSWIFVLDPTWILYSKEILTEPIFVLLILLALFLGLVGLTRLLGEPLPGDRDFERLEHLPAAHLLGYSGLLFGFATLFKPITLYLPVAGALLFAIIFVLRRTEFRAVHGWDRNLIRHYVSVALIFLISIQSVAITWQLRNYMRHDTFAFTSIQADNLMTGHAAFVLASAEGITHEQAQSRILSEFNTKYPDHGVYTFDALSSAKTDIASRILRAYPGHYVVSIFRGMAVTLLDPGRLVLSRTLGNTDSESIGLTNTLSKDGITGVFVRLFSDYPALSVFMVLQLLWLTGILIVAGWGFWVLARRFPLVALVVGLFFLYLWGLGGPSGYARFRMYLLPMMVIFAAFCPLADRLTSHRVQ